MLPLGEGITDRSSCAFSAWSCQMVYKLHTTVFSNSAYSDLHIIFIPLQKHCGIKLFSWTLNLTEFCCPSSIKLWSMSCDRDGKCHLSTSLPACGKEDAKSLKCVKSYVNKAYRWPTLREHWHLVLNYLKLSHLIPDNSLSVWLFAPPKLVLHVSHHPPLVLSCQSSTVSSTCCSMDNPSSYVSIQYSVDCYVPTISQGHYC